MMTQSRANVKSISNDFFDTDTPLCGHKFTLINAVYFIIRHGFTRINTAFVKYF